MLFFQKRPLLSFVIYVTLFVRQFEAGHRSMSTETKEDLWVQLLPQLRGGAKKKRYLDYSDLLTRAASATSLEEQQESFSIEIIQGNANPVYQYPPSAGGNDKKLTEDLSAVPLFCFPDEEEEPSDPREKQQGQDTFYFIMTASDGSKKFGFARRWKGLMGGNTAICFLSKRPWFHFFNQSIQLIDSHQKMSTSISEAQGMLDKIYHVDQLKTKEGNKTKLMLDDFGSIDMSLKPGFSEFGDVTFFYLMNSLTRDSIVKIMASMVWERRVIFSSSSPSHLSSTVMAFNAALYPFAWQGILIPLLPSSLIHYCCAPMPFVVGVMDSNLETLWEMPIEEIVFVDLDGGRVHANEAFNNDVSMLPPHAVNQLKSALKPLRVSAKKCTSPATFDTEATQKAMLRFWLNIVGRVRDHKVGGQTGKSSFNREAFENEQPKSIQKFLFNFKDCQMYHQFILGIENQTEQLVQFEREAEHFTQEMAMQAEHQQETGAISSIIGGIQNFRKNTTRKDSDPTSDRARASLDVDRTRNVTATNSSDSVMSPETSRITTATSVKHFIRNMLERKSTASSTTTQPNNKPVIRDLSVVLEKTPVRGVVSENMMMELKRRLQHGEASDTRVLSVPTTPKADRKPHATIAIHSQHASRPSLNIPPKEVLRKTRDSVLSRSSDDHLIMNRDHSHSSPLVPFSLPPSHPPPPTPPSQNIGTAQNIGTEEEAAKPGPPARPARTKNLYNDLVSMTHTAKNNEAARQKEQTRSLSPAPRPDTPPQLPNRGTLRRDAEKSANVGRPLPSTPQPHSSPPLQPAGARPTTPRPPRPPQPQREQPTVVTHVNLTPVNVTEIGVDPDGHGPIPDATGGDPEGQENAPDVTPDVKTYAASVTSYVPPVNTVPTGRVQMNASFYNEEGGVKAAVRQREKDTGPSAMELTLGGVQPAHGTVRSPTRPNRNKFGTQGRSVSTATLRKTTSQTEDDDGSELRNKLAQRRDYMDQVT
ncbi:DENN/MADD domain containing 2D [Planoprotostelium fungivorum]|uniref:DENN/MADD domain containing 2D n=1 Tax=Planoprotostelium fungivorum TaxID=1890364 RepID=A0A2P6NW73_9EUKA|nr:DENN/MADD domain containing 2D [Planoprotostelium fungivorum]